ncbi:uncharacterized protein BX663DRAFT_5235 [Cokeromyces recurvatus]|uniref:uncharacterized protein n=1 Tax=Cokeromyces recurvatus TaxID=90255 RepID=UPI00221EB4A1|nr:uncharacterized protein BX663DRAFT_5235 [Cokeromyces recurvatus]KAI7907597.1 hypothetical protein BX663DRAFT_5235 [Cokeromyces recurvatus]
MLDDEKFMAVMAQITEALQKVPHHTKRQYPNYNSKFYNRKIVPNDGNYYKRSEIADNSLPTTTTRKYNNDFKTSSTLSTTSSFSTSFHEDIDLTNPLSDDFTDLFSEKELHVLQYTKSSHLQQLLKEEEDEEEILRMEERKRAFMVSSPLNYDIKNYYNDFSTCLQRRIEAQVKKVARSRSTKKAPSSVSL